MDIAQNAIAPHKTIIAKYTLDSTLYESSIPVVGLECCDDVGGMLVMRVVCCRVQFTDGSGVKTCLGPGSVGRSLWHLPDGSGERR